MLVIMSPDNKDSDSKKLYYGWKIVVVMVLLMLPASLVTNAASIFYVPVTEDLHVKLAAFGVNLTIIQLVSAFGDPTILAYLCRKIDMRYVLSLSLAVEAGGFIMRSLATHIWVFYISSVFLALPLGVFFNLGIQILMNNWFPKNTGTTTGIVASGQGLGGMLFNFLGSMIIQSAGWRVCFLVWAGICFACIPMTLAVIRTSPSQLGLLPYGVSRVASLETPLDAGSSTSEKPANTQASATSGAGLTAREAMRTAPFYLIALILMLTAFTANYTQYVNSYCLSIGMSAVTAGALASVIQGGVLFYKLTLGAISDRKLVAGMFYYVLSAIVAFSTLLICGPNTALIILSCFLFGGIYAACNLYGPLVVKELYGTKDFINIWARVVTFFTLAGAMGATVWGAVVDALGYVAGFGISLGLVIVMLVLYGVVFSMRKRMRARWEGKQAEFAEHDA